MNDEKRGHISVNRSVLPPAPSKSIIIIVRRDGSFWVKVNKKRGIKIFQLSEKQANPEVRLRRTSGFAVAQTWQDKTFCYYRQIGYPRAGYARCGATPLPATWSP